MKRWKSRIVRISTALILGATMLAFSPVSRAATPTVSQPVLLAGGLGNQMNPSLAGGILTYDDCPLPYQPCTIMAHSFANGESYQVATGVEYRDFESSKQRTDGASVVWVGTPLEGLYVTDLSNNEPRGIPGASRTRHDLGVWGNIVVWTDRGGATEANPVEYDIYMYDLAAEREVAVSKAPGAQTRPATNGKVIVWQDARKSRTGSSDTDIYGYNISTGREFAIATTQNMETDPAISGNTVVWVSQDTRGNYTLMSYDLAANRMSLLVRNAPATEQGNMAVMSEPAIWGNVVVWVRAEFPQGPGPALKSAVLGYDLASRQQFTIVDGSGGARSTPRVSGNRVVWVESSSSFADGVKEIKGATLAGVALAPVDTPARKPAPTSITFPQTGKTVQGRFLDYWLKHGGLPQQGFPISGLLQERSDLDGKTYTVQYFERAVFELHPENKSPYDVLLSQLGTFRYREKHAGTPQPQQLHGSIKGRLSYPSEMIPPLNIYAIPADGIGPYHSVRTWANTLEYTIEGVLPGKYYVVAYLGEPSSTTFALGYTEYARCIQANPNNAANCTGHDLLEVTVASGHTVEGISPIDFAPPERFPTQPADGPDAGWCQLFKETGHYVCGPFLRYWYAHGGLAQQGYPLAQAFDEKSDLDGKVYRVQYFERAVFELHPENKPPYDVLLSQLGTFRYREKYQP